MFYTFIKNLVGLLLLIYFVLIYLVCNQNETSIFIVIAVLPVICIFFIVFNVGCYLYQKNIIPPTINYRKQNILVKYFNRYYKKLINDPNELKRQFEEIDDPAKIKFEMPEISTNQLNGSFVKGYSGKVEYIAMDEPNDSNIKKFWKLILEENIQLIVMISKFDESGFKYIPRHQETIKICVDTEIRCNWEQNFDETHFIRNLQLRKDCVQRNITHMQLVDWPKLGVPSSMEDYLQFCKNVRERFKQGLIMVQSSTGSGGAGTLIATDILLQAIQLEKSINIYRTVLELRMQRPFMVQNEDQYTFIHSCINEVLIESNRKSKKVKSSETTYENVGNVETIIYMTPQFVDDEPIYEEIE